jgi:hypothetical protein
MATASSCAARVQINSNQCAGSSVIAQQISRHGDLRQCLGAKVRRHVAQQWLITQADGSWLPVREPGLEQQLGTVGQLVK